VALCFYWDKLNIQIRIEGSTTQVSDFEADKYFANRPRGHQINAIISKQSSTLDSYENLLLKYNEAEKEFAENELKRPEYWTGFIIAAKYFEFWQDGLNRCHIRKNYIKNQNSWNSNLLYP